MKDPKIFDFFNVEYFILERDSDAHIGADLMEDFLFTDDDEAFVDPLDELLQQVKAEA